MIVECDGETLPSEMKEMERGRIEAFFIPRRAGVHKISMTFNGEKVPGNDGIHSHRNLFLIVCCETIVE